MPKDDQTYGEAAQLALGKSIGRMFMGMVAEGMQREEALFIMSAYVKALAERPTEKKDDAEKA